MVLRTGRCACAGPDAATRPTSALERPVSRKHQKRATHRNDHAPFLWVATHLVAQRLQSSVTAAAGALCLTMAVRIADEQQLTPLQQCDRRRGSGISNLAVAPAHRLDVYACVCRRRVPFPLLLGHLLQHLQHRQELFRCDLPHVVSFRSRVCAYAPEPFTVESGV